MKKRYYLVTAAIAYLGFLVMATPAHTALALIKGQFPQFNTHGASGTLWNGSAQQISLPPAHTVKQANWSFRGWRLPTGEICFYVEAQYKDQPFTTQISLGMTGKVYARQLKSKINAKLIGEMAKLPLGELSGEIHIDLDYLTWEKGEIPLAEGLINWNNASIKVAESVNLGNVAIELSDSEDWPLAAIISNRGGQLNLDGNAYITDDANYNLELKLVPEKSAGNNLRSSLSMIANKQADGSFVLNNNGHLKQLGIM